MPELRKKPTLKNYSTYVKELEAERGFIDQTARDKCLLLGEEVGELFKAVRKAEGYKIDDNSEFHPIAEELVDILIYLFSIANRYEVDLESEFRKKKELNKKRIWHTAPN